MNLRQSLSGKIEELVRVWVERVERDGKIDSDARLTYQAIRDRIPSLLEALVVRLADTDDSAQLRVLRDHSCEHGSLRADQGFNPIEIAREYRLLREVLQNTLASDLAVLSAVEVFETMQTIDRTIDDAIAYCFESYTYAKLERIESLRIQLLLTNRELTRLVQDNHNCLSYLTHEIKNPLNSIIGYSSILLRQQQRQGSELPQGSTKNLQYLERVLKQGRQLLRLVNDTTEIARSHSGELHREPSKIDLCNTLDNLAELFRPMAQSKRLSLQMSCILDDTTLVTDELRLDQILANLLSNAIRYTKEGGITVSVTAETSDRLTIQVSDTGVGIPQDELDCLFDPYYRASSSDAEDGGTGLGLAVVRQLVDLLEGEVRVNSELGRGSTFTLMLPRHVASAKR